MSIAIVGSKDFKNFDFLEKTILDNYKIENITELISGGAIGADTLAEQFAIKHSIPMSIFKLDWDVYGKSAGYKQNIQIIDTADEVIAFWDGISRGTARSLKRCKELKTPITIIWVE